MINSVNFFLPLHMFDLQEVDGSKICILPR